jgi:predicted nucleotidyltransferase
LHALETFSRAPRTLRWASFFGSFARDEARCDSDADIAVSFARADIPLRRELDLQRELELTLGRDVDLVSLDRAEPPLKWRVARDGI